MIVSVCYFTVASVYILLSGQIAALVSMSVSELAKVEQIKGCLFVLTTTILLFVLVFWMFKRIAADEQQIESYRDVLIASERRAAAGLFASSVAHDIGSILTISKLATSQLGSGTEIPKDKRYLVEQLEHVLLAPPLDLGLEAAHETGNVLHLGIEQDSGAALLEAFDLLSQYI